MTSTTPAPLFVLGSASPARRATLVAAGINPLVVVSRVDEPALLAAATARFGTLEPADAVLVLAQAKADDVAAQLEHTSEDVADSDPSAPTGSLPDGSGADDAADPAAGDATVGPTDDTDVARMLVLGADSMLEFDGQIYGKPDNAEQARSRWQAMRGSSAVLHTGHWLIDLRTPDNGGSGGTLGATSSTTVHFAELTDAEIDAYIATGEPLSVAGGFTIDGLGGAFITGIEGDHHGVVGLSLPLLRELLAQVEVTLPDLWPPRNA